MNKLLISHAYVVTMDDENRIFKDGFIGIEDGRIAFVSEKAPRSSGWEVIDAEGRIVMPGLINTHTHLAMCLMRGYADDMVLQSWLEDKVFPTEARLDERCVYLGALLGIAESLRFGTTSVSDMYLAMPAVYRAAYESGIKANICDGAVFTDEGRYDIKSDHIYKNLVSILPEAQKTQGRIKMEAGIHAEYTSRPDVWRQWAEFACENKLGIQLHLSETEREHKACIEKYGKTPAQVMAESGVFDVRATAAHCVWLSSEDMDILRDKKVTAAHNPVSNLKLGSGIAPVSGFLKRGVRTSLGTDGACSNNGLDMFEEIKLAALLQKGITGNPENLPARDALFMATRAGALAQGREGQCGIIAEGADADIIMIDTDKLWLRPVHDPQSTLCYSASGRDVCMTMVRGQILYRNGSFTTIDTEKLMDEIHSYALPRLFDK